MPARVYLVGAGPGDPGLLTLRGAEVLRRAEVVIYDGLVNRDLLRLAPPNVELIYGGKHDRDRAVPQAELNALMLAKAREGKRVVRLKGGDPYVFGRGGEEAELLAEAGIPFEVVPGISSAEAVPNYAGIPLTHRDCTASYTVITGHEDSAQLSKKLNLAHVAQLGGTLVVLMGLKNLRQIIDALIAHGRAPDTPAAVISKGAGSRQRTVTGTLATIADAAARESLTPPAVTVIGEVVRLRETLNWFERQPLFGQRIVVTQRRDLSQPLVALLREHGAEVLEIPATRFGPPNDTGPLDRVVADLKRYNWVIFTNPMGLEVFLCFFFGRFKDLREMGPARLATCGPIAAERLRAWHLEPAAVAEDHKTPLIVDALTRAGGVKGQRVLLLRGEDTLDDLPAAIKGMGGTLEDVACFGTSPEPDDPTGHAAAFRETGSDWVVFASALAIEHFHERFDLPALKRRRPQLRLAIFSPAIRWALEELGLEPDVTARPNDVESMAEAIVGAVAGAGASTNGSAVKGEELTS